jgi:hypothetical protein
MNSLWLLEFQPSHKEYLKMQRAIFIVLFFGLVASTAPAQPGPADEPSIEPTHGGRGAPYGMSGRAGREYRLDPRQTQRLVGRWKASKQDAEREKVEAELRNALKREFAARLAAHEKEIKNLEEKVRQLRERLTLRREKQDEIVDHRLQQLLRDAQGLGWGSEVAGRESIFHYPQATNAAQTATDDLFGPATSTESLHEAEDEDIFGGAAPSADSALAPK